MSSNKLGSIVKAALLVKVNDIIKRERSSRDLLNDFIGFKPDKEYEEIKKKPR